MDKELKIQLMSPLLQLLKKIFFVPAISSTPTSPTNASWFVLLPMPGSLCLVAEVHSITWAHFKVGIYSSCTISGKKPQPAAFSHKWKYKLSSNAAGVIKPLDSHITLGMLFLSLPSVSDAKNKCRLNKRAHYTEDGNQALMLNTLTRETQACLDIDRQSSDFLGIRRVINVCPWLNYPFSLLLTAASQALDTLSALFPTHTLLPHHASTTPLCGWTAIWLSWKPTWKQNSVPKCDLPQSCMNICVGTRGKKQTVRGWEHTALGMSWSSWSYCHQGHALSRQTLLQCRGQTAFLFEKVR